jgi:glycosyltransferase involved in cell wall biosynthesis
MSGPLGGASSSALRLAVVGPSHPHKGGVAAHTTTLAHHLAGAGHDVTLVSWSHLYPSRLYPGEQAVPGGTPDVPPFPRTVRALSWARPDTWVRAGRRLRGFDAIIVVHVIPPVIPAHLALLRAAGSGPRSIVLAHNVLPHESRPGDRRLMEALMRRVDAVLVHSAEQAVLARELGAARVSVAALPPHLPGGSPTERAPYDGPPRLLALGMVREYKGVDLLLRARQQVPGVTLTVAGELWGASGTAVRELADDPRVRGRVRVQAGYVPADRLAELLASHDVLALTYRSATASQNALLGQAHGLPVLASDVGTFGTQVRDGVDGLLVPPGDEQALVAALRRLNDPVQLRRLQENVHTPDLSSPWAHYVGALEALASPSATAGDPDLDDPDDSQGPIDRDDPDGPDHGGGDRADGRDAGLAPSVTGRLLAPLRRVLSARRPALTLTRADLPEWIRASDVLTDGADADQAREWARGLGLPRAGDPVAAWAALGAIAAIVRVSDDGRHSAVIVDESGIRSPLARWARAIGFAPVELGLTGERASVAVLDVDPGALDVITRLHPSGCDADDVDEVLSQASWALRSGGLISLTLPLGPATAEGAVGPVEVRGILARAHDVGFVLVGDLDGDITARMRGAGEGARRSDAAYALVRLTFRRR